MLISFRLKNKRKMNQMKITFAILLLSIGNLLFSQDSLSILFIGNSYTYVNDLPTVLKDLTVSKGDKLTYDSRTQGGATFSNHVSNASTYTAIQSKLWDFVTIQGQSQELSFPTSQVNTNSEPFIQRLADSIHKNNYCSQILMFMTWGRQNGDPQWDSIATYQGMQERLTNTAVRMADSISASISPVGVAWKYIRDNHPAINLYTSDGSHPSFEGTYLAACTFYTSLFRKPSSGATYIGTLDPTTAEILQEAADLTVLDSLERWNLHALSDQTIANFSYTINLNTVSFSNNSIHGTTYHWDFGDGQESSETNPSNSYSTNGIYNVELIAIDSCDSDTITLEVVVSNLGINSISINKFLLKNLANNQYSIESSLNEEFESKVFDMNGKQMNTTNDMKNDVIDINNYPKGVYFIHVKNSESIQSFKIINH